MSLLNDLAELINFRLRRKKTKLEVKKIEEEFRAIQQASWTDVKSFDPKIDGLIKSIRDGEKHGWRKRAPAKKKAAPKKKK